MLVKEEFRLFLFFSCLFLCSGVHFSPKLPLKYREVLSCPPCQRPPPPQPPRLLDLVRQVARTRFGQDGPGDRFASWTRRLILFHAKRHPRDLSPGDVGRFLEHVAHTEKDPLACLEQAHTALTFLDQDVLGLDVGDLPCPEPPRLLDRLRRACRVRQFSPRTEDCYARWAERFIRFHGLRHPNTMGAPEIERFLTDLAANGQVTGSVKVYAGS